MHQSPLWRSILAPPRCRLLSSASGSGPLRHNQVEAREDGAKVHMKKEPKDQRVHVLMTQAELNAIDDFRFMNRIPSRGEAIRLLCRDGLQKPRKSRLTATDVSWTSAKGGAVITVSVGSENFDLHLSDSLSRKLSADLLVK